MYHRWPNNIQHKGCVSANNKSYFLWINIQCAATHLETSLIDSIYSYNSGAFCCSKSPVVSIVYSPIGAQQWGAILACISQKSRQLGARGVGLWNRFFLNFNLFLCPLGSLLPTVTTELCVNCSAVSTKQIYSSTTAELGLTWRPGTWKHTQSYMCRNTHTFPQRLTEPHLVRLFCWFLGISAVQVCVN